MKKWKKIAKNIEAMLLHVLHNLNLFTSYINNGKVPQKNFQNHRNQLSSKGARFESTE